MPLQNRSDPFGVLHAATSRGMFTGNRGIIHNPESKTLSGRRWTTRSWIICICEWKGRRRQPMGRNRPDGGAGWTEIFFLDEVTALAAGHRPCFFCRRQAARDFAATFASGNGLPNPAAGLIDTYLHAQRRLSAKVDPQILAPDELPELPDGTVVEAGGNAFALRSKQAMQWSFAGYGTRMTLAKINRIAVTLVTPRSTVAAMGAGYIPVWHESAGPEQAA